MEVHQLKDQLWELESQILNVEKHLEQDIDVVTQDLKLWLDIGPVKNGSMKISEVRQIIKEALEDKVKECPAPTQDLELNTKNRNDAIQAEHIQYGPLNVKVPGDYFEKIAKFWKTSVDAAESRCPGWSSAPRAKRACANWIPPPDLSRPQAQNGN